MKKDYEQAIKFCSYAIKLDPDYALAYFYRGLIFDSMGKKISARNDLLKAKKLGFSDEQEMLDKL